MSKSTHAGKLRELGFEKAFTVRPGSRNMVFAHLEYQDGGALVQATMAVDETNQAWEADGHIDLTALGFDNLTHELLLGTFRVTSSTLD